MEHPGPYFKVKRTQVEMIRDRGYALTPILNLLPLAKNVDETELLNISREDFRIRYSFFDGIKQIFQPRFLNQLYPKYNAEGKMIGICFVFYQNNFKDDSFLKEHVNDLMQYHLVLQEYARNQPDMQLELIVISRDNLAGGAPELFRQIWKSYHKITIFEGLHKVIANPTKHFLGSSYQKLTDVEKREYNLSISNRQTPYLSYHDLDNPGPEKFMDPVVAYYGWSVQDVVAIEREIFYTNYPVRHTLSYRTVQSV